MLNPYTLNIQESLKHAWHWGIGFLRCLAAKVLIGPVVSEEKMFVKVDRRWTDNRRRSHW